MGVEDFRVVIMAGGTGTRFWPLSRKKSPKQFLPIISDKTMIEETAARLQPLVPFDKIYTVADRSHTEEITRLLKNIPEENKIVEPQGRNTAPSIMLATAAIHIQNPHAVLAVLPADHMISAPEIFREKLAAGASAADALKGLITFGISPSYPATGYGYIHFAEDRPVTQGEDFFYPVVGFKEKPDYDQACDFIKSGNYAWNSGMFLWNTSVFADALKKYAPEMSLFWEQILAALKSDDSVALEDIFERIPAQSIDYALMEKAEGVFMSKGNFGWSDVGSWSALPDIWGKDPSGNARKGDVIAIDSQNCLTFTPDKLTALIGIRDVIVVESEDALLICHKDQDQRVKEIVERLKKGDRSDLL